MTTVQVAYVPGTWVAVSGRAAWLLVDLRPDHGTVQRLWSLLSADAEADRLLDALVVGGIGHAPSFALADMSGDRVRVLARGSASVTLGGSERAVKAADGTAWADEIIDGADGPMTLHSDTAPGSAVELPMAGGVTMAAAICIRPSADTEGAVHAVAPIGGAKAASAVIASRVQDANASEAPPSGGAADEDDDEPAYDYLFGATRLPPAPEEDRPTQAEPAQDAVTGWPAGEPDGPAGLSETRGWSTTTPPENAITDEGLESEVDGGVVDSVPWARPAPAVGRPSSAAARQTSYVPASPASTPASVSGPGRHEPGSRAGIPDDMGHTTARSSLQFSHPDATAAGPTVLAGYCPAGHLSPPFAANCRVCSTPMPTQDPVEIARPPLGVLRLSTGDLITLDRRVLLGRAPADPAAGDERPHLVKLTSPGNDISRNHAEVILDGWHVLLRDLDSTNGTMVRLPGRAPVRLRPNDLQLLEHGTVVMLADDVGFTFEVTP